MGGRGPYWSTARGKVSDREAPFGPPARGMGRIQEAVRRAASTYRDGRALEFEKYAKCVTTDIALRTTSVFRPEGGDWKLVHRHAGPMATSRPADSVIHSA